MHFIIFLPHMHSLRWTTEPNTHLRSSAEQSQQRKPFKISEMTLYLSHAYLLMKSFESVTSKTGASLRIFLAFLQNMMWGGKRRGVKPELVFHHCHDAFDLFMFFAYSWSSVLKLSVRPCTKSAPWTLTYWELVEGVDLVLSVGGFTWSPLRLSQEISFPWL